jgi:hypothetical protein
MCVLCRKDPTRAVVPNLPIDYSYVRLQHIAAANALCHEFFWPGIDRTCDLDLFCSLKQNYIRYLFTAQRLFIFCSVLMLSVSECLQYPDFSCVALYRQVYNISASINLFQIKTEFSRLSSF